MYYYVIDEYRVSNQLLTEDIYVGAPLCLQARDLARRDIANTSAGSPVRGTTDRRLRQDPGREGRDRKEVSYRNTWTRIEQPKPSRAYGICGWVVGHEWVAV